MTGLPFDRPGRFWRGNLHTHSNRSDGALSPEESLRHYRDAGYDFVALTDHFRAEYGFPVTDTRPLRTAGFTTLLGAELHAPRTEAGPSWHIVAVGLPLDFAPLRPGETGPQLARRARNAGAFVGMAHPSASLLTAADAESLEAAHAVEVYNALSAREDRGDSWHLTDVLLNRGHRLTVYAADDAHFQPQDPPGCAAWVQVRAESLDPDQLVAALKAGHFYSSTGPELHDVRVDGGLVSVRCSPARKVLLTGGVPGAQVAQGEALTECSLPVEMFRHGYCRVTVEDAAGGRAWTNPIHLAAPPGNTASAEA
ncbi:putative metal-dependent phosphoesterase (PHP family) [Streptomyces ambofaciens ATCC 23877]|uniref:Putative metal-dependent phosphoesterase (PHP family) n=1 Tax=Streptomyces ambofaciens (strain ATCC 23877 / 3486 / DSM 40053 / JCM 4204 / NBRC 12836 / NRRL B-2516) TaxID=278992 RepID=A0AE64_STRA7|nr:CehA/McbA family metallohydrolase [Streptomyces ambofaciens]AKZ59553.1 putative metal-dependent phosphoesterase (PHP family) [Streptomyces ambofaciens ATCC 23877]CAJ88773.1 putative metal-dependent phosphoesterase (PHP family) [Streptomyces ambofaciens ATCC 23877]